VGSTLSRSSCTNIVHEGNRRLAALRLLSDPDLRVKMSYQLPELDAPRSPPTELRVRYVSSRAEARRFIAFKHITGPLKWDAYAKAKYANDWLKEGEDIEVVSKMLGDSHNTVRRLVVGFHVLKQAETWGFNLNDRTKKRFAFFHLYKAISRPSVRAYRGIDDDEEEFSAIPVPDDKGENLDRLMS
jgi:hypothetical protein